MSITSIPRTISEIAALTQTTTPSQTAGNATTTATWEQDAYASAPIASPYPSYEKPASPPGSVPAPPYTGKIDFMSESEIRAEDERLTKEGLTIDYTGLSDVEIYQAIFDRYAAVFGEACLGSPGNLPVSEATRLAIDGFEAELKRNFGSIDNVCAINRERLGFDGMSYEQAEQAVMQKYAGKTLTMRDVCYINTTLCSMGYSNGTSGALGRIIYSVTSQGDRVKSNLFLDSPFDMAKAQKTLESFGLPETDESRQMTTNLYGMFASLIRYGLYEPDPDMFDFLMDHLSKNAVTTTTDYYLEK